MSDFDLLVVDDEPVVLEATRRVLSPEGVSLDAASDGVVAVERLRRRSYGLVLLDLMLPGVSGLELLDHLVTEHRGTPVVVTSGYATSQKCVEVLSAGAFDFLPKPFDVEELLGVVRRGSAFARRATDQGERLRAPAGLYHLGRHSWARVEEDGLVTLGLDETFEWGIGESPGLRLPAGGSETVQGKRFARIESAGPCVHQIWAPLSGRVVGSNPRLESDPQLAVSSPLTTGWLTRISPTNRREELDELTLR